MSGAGKLTVTSMEVSNPAGRTRELANTAGEFEHEARSRKANLLEALAMVVGVLATLWGVAYGLGLLYGFHAANLASRAIIAGLVLFAMLISPRWHGDTLSSWGLGSPAHLFRVWSRGSSLARILLPALFFAAVAVLTFELYRNATGASHFVLGIEPAVTIRLQQRLGGKAMVLGLCLLLAFGWAACVVRYDNLWPALKAAAKILAVLLPLTLLVGWATNGPGSFRGARIINLVRLGLGYVFWGAIQQLLFCSYFGTRLRKGFRPAVRPRYRKWKRLGVAALNGLFFGLIHINSWLLVGFTWVLGIFLSWYFMQDRYRNLQVFGLVHGILGTCVVWLFSQNPAPVRIRLRVGPWSMPHRPDALTLSVVGVVILALVCGAAAVAFRGAAQGSPTAPAGG